MGQRKEGGGGCVVSEKGATEQAHGEHHALPHGSSYMEISIVEASNSLVINLNFRYYCDVFKYNDLHYQVNLYSNQLETFITSLNLPSGKPLFLFKFSRKFNEYGCIQ